jgi:hypothetical protein
MGAVCADGGDLMNTIDKFIEGYIEGLIFAHNLIAKEDIEYINKIINYWFEYHANRYSHTIPILQAYHEGIMSAYEDVI